MYLCHSIIPVDMSTSTSTRVKLRINWCRQPTH